MKLARSAAAVCCAALLLAGCSGRNAVDQSGGSFRYIGTTPRGTTIAPAERKTAGQVTGALLGGGTYSLAADRGKVVVLNFWASWCSPCRNESPGLDSLYRELKAGGLDVVGLDVKDPNLDAATSFIRDYHISYPIVRDPNAETALELGRVPLSIGLPWTVVIDKQQRVAAVYNGEVFPADLRPVLTALIAGH